MYRAYPAVLSQVAEACAFSVANFDDVLRLLAKNLPPLHDFEKMREIGPSLGHVALPPAG